MMGRSAQKGCQTLLGLKVSDTACERSVTTAAVLFALMIIVRPVWAVDETVPTETQYARIQQAFLQEQFAQVADLVPPILADAFLEPKTVRIWLWLVLSQERLQRAPEALGEMDRLKTSLSNLPDTTAVNVWTESVWPEILFWEGEVSRKAQKMVRARVAYQRLLQGYPNSVWGTQAQLGLGLVHLHEQAYDQANAQFEQVSRTSTNKTIAHQALLWQGLCQLQAKRLDEAVARFRELLEQPAAPSLRGQAAFYLGETLTSLRRFDEASQVYRQAMDLDGQAPWLRDAFFGLGWSEFQQGRCEQSLQAFEDYLRVPESAPATVALSQQQGRVSGEALFAQGRCLRQLGRSQEALARFEALYQQAPDHPLAVEATLSAVELHQQMQRLDGALSLAQTLATRPMQPGQRLQWHLRMGALRLDKGEAAEAQAEFEQAVTSTDASIRQAAFNGMGDAALMQGQPSEAVRRYQEAVAAAAASPGARYATYQLGRIKLHSGQADEAAVVFRELLGQSSVVADPALATDVRLALAFVAIAQQDPERAQADLEALREQPLSAPQAARASYYLALLAVEAGDADEAQRWCQDAVARGARSDESVDARLLLADVIAAQASPAAALSQLRSLMVTDAASLPRHQRGKLAKKLGDLARRMRDYAQAIAWYEQAWEDLPTERGELDYRLASCYEEGSDIGSAIQRYRMIQQPPWSIRGQLALAKLMEREERWQEAMSIYQGIATQLSPEATIAQERLAFLQDQALDIASATQE